MSEFLDDVVKDAVYLLREKYPHPLVTGSWSTDENGISRGPKYRFISTQLDSRGRLGQISVSRASKHIDKALEFYTEFHKDAMQLSEIDLGTLGSLVVKR